MLKDNLNREGEGANLARGIIPQINALTDFARSRKMPVIFANDSYLPGDFLFRGRMKEHALRGTAGAEVCEELIKRPGDMELPKRRFSAFFKTDLDLTLRSWGVEAVALAGINSHWCVLATAFDALSNDFCAFIISDCCASYQVRIHETVMAIYRKNILFPLFQVLTLGEFKDFIIHGSERL